MHLRELYGCGGGTGRSFSFEFFPPKTDEAADALFATIARLEALRPSFVSVTYGAGGSTRQRTHDLVVRITRETDLRPMPHLTGVCHNAREIDAILERYARAGIANIMTLRGDAPADGGGSESAFPFAVDLVRRIVRFNESGGHPSRAGFGIAVAGYPEGHPQTPNRLLEMDRLKAKIDAGADAIFTQMFFENRDFLDFRERCELAGIRVPIVAGIMPITSIQGMRRMAELAAGVRYPAALSRSIARAAGDPESVRAVGVHWATEQCRDLLDHGVAGIHFYTLNRSSATREIYRTLGVKDSRALV